MHKLHRKFLLKNGWFLDKETPLRIRNEDGSIATGIAAEGIINNLNFPEVIIQWYHPILEITCEELLLEKDIPQNFECVWNWKNGKANSIKPYYDYVRIGDYWIVNGAWWGRKEKDGFRVLATHHLIKCDRSLWQRKQILKENDFYDDDEDMICF